MTNIFCHYYQTKKCVSCTWITKPYAAQLDEKQQMVASQLQHYNPKHLLPPVASSTIAFRNKAKMAVLGTVEKPILGIVTDGDPVDLCDCPLYSELMRSTLHLVKEWIKKLGLVPYNINKKKGEIKFIILTQANDKFMLRFVLRSVKEQYKIADTIAMIKNAIPQLAVISINIQPEHAAIIEGSQEFILTDQQKLPITLNSIPLFMQKGSFFQTNTDVASRLYATARQWLAPLSINLLWDLFCGVGGFGLHCVTEQRSLVGIEINPEAIACAKTSAQLIGYHHMTFQSLDATKLATMDLHNKPDIVLVNPPRRGLGEVLINYLQQVSPDYILYSSCNLATLVSDLNYLTCYQIDCVQLFDMFPHTPHMEVLVMLQKIN